MAEWKRVRLGDVACIKTGKLNSCAATIDGRYPFFTCAEFPLKIDTYAYDSESVLVAGNCTPYVNYYKGKFNAYQRTYIITPSVTYVSAKWLYYLMKRNIRQMIHQQQGTVEKYFVLSDFTDEELLLPPLPTQRKIAAVLGAIDDKIETNRKICVNLEAQAQAIFKSWFVDFDRCVVTTKQMQDVFDVFIGRTPPRKEFEWFSTNRSNNYIWVSIADMANCGSFIADSSEYLTQGAIKKFNFKIAPKGTVLLSFKLTVGRVAIADKALVTNEAIAQLRSNDDRYREYLYCYLKQFDFDKLGSTSSIATAVNSTMIREMPFVVPSESALVEFHNVVAPMFEKMKTLLSESRALAAMRDALLPKLMSGEIDVSNVEVA